MKEKSQHIVDVLIEERAPKLAATPFWPIIRPVLNALLGYNKAVEMVDFVKNKSGLDALLYVSELLQLRNTAKGFGNLPKQGRVIVVANHPTGIADGVALFDVLHSIRPDFLFYANSDALRCCPRFDETIIPVEWVTQKRTLEKTRITLRETKAAMENEKILAIFPAGRLARKENGKLIDPEWSQSAVSLAKKYNAPILPVHISGPNAFWFHTFDKISQELRDITLFHELLNKKNQEYDLIAGQLIHPSELHADNREATLKLKSHVEWQLR